MRTTHRRLARLIATAVATVVAAAALTGCGSDPVAEVPTVWPAPADATAAAQKAGLQMLGREMLEVHYHAHLDVIVHNQKITVPANLGIDVARKTITPLHTHDSSGIIHIESDKDIPFTLGQVFTEWGQPLSPVEVGPVAATSDEQVRVYRNGKLIAGNPAALKLGEHDEIVVWLGPINGNPKVPSSFNFPEGV